jgi:anthranilate/para-aminobenzoate synthase component I
MSGEEYITPGTSRWSSDWKENSLAPVDLYRALRYSDPSPYLFLFLRNRFSSVHRQVMVGWKALPN